jgi:hypothetical protein
MSKIEGEEVQLPELVSDPLTYAYITAMLLQIPAEEKQVLLEINDPLALIEKLQRTYQREVALLKVLLQSVAIELGEGISFSKN